MNEDARTQEERQLLITDRRNRLAEHALLYWQERAKRAEEQLRQILTAKEQAK